MGKFKLAHGKAKTASDAKRAVPCLILVVAGIALIGILFYYVMKSSLNAN
jgi:hypothetical protein